MRLILFIVTLLCCVRVSAEGAPGSLPVIPAGRVEEIAGWLDSGPVSFTPSFDDRVFWTGVHENRRGREIVAQADLKALEPTPGLTGELYNDYQATGRREAFEIPFAERTVRLGLFLFAEGFVGDGSRLPLIKREIEAILDEPSWAVPAHAAQRQGWQAARDMVDLAAVTRAWDLSLADQLLGDRLPGELRARIRREVRSRVLEPYIMRLRAADKGDFHWMNGGNNWNAICNAGVLASALLLAEDARERAELVAAFEALTAFYIDGFGDDGFCHEGMGYWSYGYRHYVMGAELAQRATGGRLDLLDGAKARRIAEFGRRWALAGGLVPAFGDEKLDTRPGGDTSPSSLLDFATLRYGGDGGLRRLSRGGRLIHRHPLGAQLYSTAFELSLARPAEGSPEAAALAARVRDGLPLRDWFPDGGALITRLAGRSAGLATAFKGGHNAQPHNHNDLGSFVIVRDGRVVLTDLGRDDYVKGTFGPDRYRSQVINSFGHPVPLVAGALQKKGASARAETVHIQFTDARDIWEIDLTGAYDVPGLRRLTRTFIFERDGEGRVEIVDRVCFSEPQAFGTALVAPAGQTFSVEADGSLRFRPVGDGGDGVLVSLVPTGGELQISQTPILGIVPDVPAKGTRIGIDFAAPVTEATLRLVVLPFHPPASPEIDVE